MAKTQDEFQIRRENRQKKIRKRRRRRAFLFILLLLLAVGVTLSLTILFPVKRVRSKGSTFYKESQILSAASVKGENIFMLSEKKLLEKVRKKLPYVSSLTFKRFLPDGVLIYIKDAKPYCYYHTKDGIYTASKEGYVLEKFAEPPEGLFEVVCNDAKCVPGEKVKIKNETQSKLAEKLLTSLSNKNFKVDSIDVSNIAEIKAGIDGRFIVNFGTGTYLDKKIAHLGGMVNSIAKDRSGEINLSMWSPQKSEGTFTEKDVG